MARLNEAQIRNEIRRRVQDLIRVEGANLDLSRLDTIDIRAIMNQMAKAWTFAEWDKTSPINGVDAQIIIERYNITPTDSVFLLLKDGQVVVFQPFHPNLEGTQKMTPATVRSIAQDMLDQQIDNAVMDEIYPLLVVNGGNPTA